MMVYFPYDAISTHVSDVEKMMKILYGLIGLETIILIYHIYRTSCLMYQSKELI